MTGAALLLTLSSPLFLLLFLVVRLESPGRFIYSQMRSGRHDRPFKMFKIRTMLQNTPVCASNDLHKPYRYITRSGRILRKLSIDELPQLLNILFGQMSFIGPRPVILQEKELIEMRREKGALVSRPGLTGWAQVNGRDMMSNEAKSDFDADYAQRMSFGLDIKIIFKTISAVLTLKGYKEGSKNVEPPPSPASAVTTTQPPKFVVSTEVISYQRKKV